MARRASILACILGLAAAALTAPAHAAGVDLAAIKADEAHWISQAQVPDAIGRASSGAITIHPSGAIRRVLPYDANIAARGMLAGGPAYCPKVLGWMKWYAGHVNWPDRFGTYATVYDWEVDWASGTERSLNHYDSADSYAASFLSLARAGAGACNAIASWLAANKSVVSAIGRVMTDPQIMASSGLTWAKSDYRVFFNMDNSEVAAGLTDAAWVASNVWADATEASWYSGHAERLKANYSGMLWLPDSAAYSPARSDGAAADPWASTRWFPDATTQVYPFRYGVISATGARATSLWSRLNSKWPQWTGCRMLGPEGKEEPFSEIGHAAAVRGDASRAGAYLKGCKARWWERGRAWPYNVRHAGTIAQLAAALP